jgi:putative FmdB family regulatory protein
MPTYVYRCQNCDKVLEQFQKITDDPLTTHEECGGALRRVVQPVGIVFKGSGFYVTDYKRNENGGSGKGADAPSSKPESTKSEGAKSESTETKSTETKSTETKPAGEKAEKKEASKPVGAGT